MKNIKLTMPIAVLLATLVAVQTASATVLTFDVEEGDAYVGNLKNIPNSYGDGATAANSSIGNYQQGNGWTPYISVTYLPQGGIDSSTGDGTKLYAVEIEHIAVPNGDFETGTPFEKGTGLPPWVYGANDATGNFFQEIRYGSTAPVWPETYPAEGPHAVGAFYKGGWAYNYDLNHDILPNATYTISFDVRGGLEPSGPTGGMGVQAYWVSGSNFIAQGNFTEAETTHEWKNKTFEFTTDDTGAGTSSGGVGQNLVLRLVQQDGHTGGEWHYGYMDNIQAKVVDPNSGYYGARTYSDGVWDKVAMLSWDTLDYATWDLIFTPEHFNFAAVLNSFDLDSYGGSGADETGTWTVYQDDENGAVIDSGSWSLGTAGANQTVNVSMTPYAGPILLRLTITGGTGGFMAVDNINFDQAPINCDGVYDGGYDMLTDVYPDCRTDLEDLRLLASDWLRDDPVDMYSEKKLVYFGNDNKLPGALAEIIDDVQDLPFDGLTVTLNGSAAFYWTSVGEGHTNPDSIEGNSAILQNMQWGRFTNNFISINTGWLIDWYDDAIWDEVLSNVRADAKIGAAGGCIGVIFDPEWTHWDSPGSMWQYDVQEHTGTYTFAEYEDKVRQRGVEFINAIEENMPNPTFMSLFWGSLLRERDFRTETDYYGLLNAFMLGILEGADPHTRIVDGDERAYYYGASQAYLDGYNIIKGDDTPDNNTNLDNTLDMVPAELHSKYQQQVQAGFAVYANVTPDASWMEFRVFWAMDTSDQYVWFYAYNGGGEPNPIGYLTGQGIDPTMPPAIRRAKAKVNADKRLGFDK